MRLVWVSLAVAQLLLIASCTSRDPAVNERAQTLLETRPHPFTLTATDSSIIAEYTQSDTVQEYSLSLWIPDEEGVMKDWKPAAGLAHPRLIPDGVYEWSFKAMALDSLPDGAHVMFGIPDADPEFEIAWDYQDGRFTPVLIGG